MNADKIASILRRAADQSKGVKDVFKYLSERERTKDHTSARAILLTMQKEGYKTEYEHVYRALKAMADAGVGQPKYDKKGEVVGLIGIGVSLKSVGEVATSRGDTELKTFKKRPQYPSLDEAEEPAPTRASSTKVVSISVPLGDRMVDVAIPDGLTPQEVGEFVSKLLSK